MQVNMTEKNNGYASFGGRGFIITTPCISCLTKNITKQGAVMANFGEVMSKFYTLGRNKGLDNGLYLHTLMLFHCMCHLREDSLNVENANKMFHKLHGITLNSASLSRNNAVLVKLGLIKLAESSTDRRQKDIIFTTVGVRFRNHFNDIPKAKEAI